MIPHPRRLFYIYWHQNLRSAEPQQVLFAITKAIA